MSLELAAAELPYWRQVMHGANRQRAVILALIFKEFKQRMGRGRIGLVWLLIEPMVHMTFISMIWYVVGRQSIDGVHVTLYISVGVVCFLMVLRGLTSVPMAIDASRALLNYPQVKPIDTVIARFILEMLLLLLAAVLLFAALWWFLDLSPDFPFPMQLAGAIGVALVLSFGCSITLCYFYTQNVAISRSVSFMARPLYFGSGIILSVRDLPTEARWYLYWNPILHLVDHWREGALGIALLQQSSLLYPSMWAVLALGIGSLVYYANRYKLIEQ